MARHVSQRTAAEVPPAAPLERVINTWPEFARRSDAQPVLPIDSFERLRDFFFLLRDDLLGVLGVVLLRLSGELVQRHAATGALRPDRAIGPRKHFLQCSQHARLD